MNEVLIERVVAGGDGLGRIDGAVCLVPYALPGDRLELIDVAKRKGVLRGQIKRVIAPSSVRKQPDCPIFGVCGGCTWLHFGYPGQAEAKRGIVTDCFKRIAGLDVAVDWADDPQWRLRYRTRATLHARAGRYGFFQAKSHDIADMTGCPLCHPKLNAAFAKLRASGLEGEFDITANPEGDDVLVWTRDPVDGLREIFAQSNSGHDRADRHQFLFDGVPVVCGGFAQSSLLLNRVLVRLVHETIEDAQAILDLYCGSGNLSLRFATDRDVAGIDHHAPSIAAARALAQAAYSVGSEAAFARAIGNRRWDAILLDPPRQGAQAIMPALVHAQANRIVYVSCDPATLARDSKTLVAAGWSIARLTAVDMFPQTAHIEAVAVFDAPLRRN